MDFMSFTSLYPALIFLYNTFTIIIVNIITITITIIIINDFQTKQGRKLFLRLAKLAGCQKYQQIMQTRQWQLRITSTTIFLFEKKSHL